MPDAIGRLHWIVIDTVDPGRIAPFCALLGVEERGWFGDDYLMLTADGARRQSRSSGYRRPSPSRTGSTSTSSRRSRRSIREDRRAR